MKQQIKATLLFVFIAAIMFAFIPPKHHLTGKWTIYDSNGNPGNEYVELKSDGTYNVYLPGGQIGERGYYKFHHSTFSIKNAVAKACGEGYWGKYNWTFMERIPFILLSLKTPVQTEDMTLSASIRACEG